MNRPALLGAALLTTALLAGCTAAGGPVGSSASPRPTSTAAPSTPATVPAATASSAPSPSATAVSSSGGIPAGASTASIGDVDGDGTPDTEFLTASAPSVYGIRLSGGGVVTTPDPLPAGGTHRAWMVATDGPTGRTVVLDDGRGATVYSYRDGRLVRLLGKDGGPFLVAIGTSVPGSTTGVNCNDQNGGVLIEVAKAVARSDGSVDVQWSTLGSVDAQGIGRLSAPETRWAGLSPQDARVAHARMSSCWAAPHTVAVQR